MGDASKYDMLLGALYVSAALFLLIVSYLILLKRLKRGKMVAKSEINLTTSRYDNYKRNQPLLRLPFEASRSFVALGTAQAA